MTNILNLSLVEASKLIETKEISPVELAQENLKQIKKTNSEYHTFITVYEEEALQVAKASETLISAGHYLGPLHGIPIALKDNIAIKGKNTTAGSKVLENWIPTENATVINKLLGHGANFIGKTNMHEFAWGGTSDNPHYGTVKNAWDSTRFPAGSSGGSAVAVATGSCFGALGTDTGGSVRLPSAVNGIVGIRPTIGRVSNYGVIPLAWSMDTVGPMTKTVEDCAVMFNAIAGYDEKDEGSVFLATEDYTKDLNKGVKGLRIGVINDFTFVDVQASVESAIKGALQHFEHLGAHIENINIANIKGNITAQLVVESCEPSAYHQKWLREQPESYGADVRLLLELGEMQLATHYIQAQRYRTLLRAELLEAFKSVDVIITPTLSFTATKVGETKVKVGDEYLDMTEAIMQFTGIPSLTGLPALNVPCGFDENGLPIGMQIIGKAFDELTLFRVGQAFESTTNFKQKKSSVLEFA